MVEIKIPKSLYDRVDRFGSVDRVIIANLTKWVEIMEDEERLAEKRFKVYLKANSIEVINRHDCDRDNDFVGTFQDICSKEVLLTIAKEGYGISEYEIEFVENVRDNN